MKTHSTFIKDTRSWPWTLGAVSTLALGMAACGAEADDGTSLPGDDIFTGGESTPVDDVAAADDDSPAIDVASADEIAPAVGAADESHVVLDAFDLTFDGTSLTMTELDVGSSDGLVPSPEGASDVGTVREPLLERLPTERVPPGTDSRETSIIALEQASPTLQETEWDTRNCGPRPVEGVCVFIKMRNLFRDARVVNAYFYLASLTPGAGDRVRVAPIDTARPNPRLTGPGIPGVRNALWRYGTLPPRTPEARAPGRHWVFTGTATGAFTFRFRGYVIGTLVR